MIMAKPVTTMWCPIHGAALVHGHPFDLEFRTPSCQQCLMPLVMNRPAELPKLDGHPADALADILMLPRNDPSLDRMRAHCDEVVEMPKPEAIVAITIKAGDAP